MSNKLSGFSNNKKLIIFTAINLDRNHTHNDHIEIFLLMFTNMAQQPGNPYSNFENEAH